MTMRSYANNHSETQRSAAANRFADERPGKVTTQQLTDNRASAVAQHQSVNAINNSPKQVAQRQRLNSLFGDAVPLKSSDNEALQINTAPLSPMENIPDSNIVQRVIDVNGEVFDNKSQTSDVVGKIMSTLGKSKGEVAKYSGRIAGMIDEGGKIPFPSYQKLYDHLAPVLPPMESQYEGQVAPPSSAVTESSIVLFRAMSDAEGGALGSSSQFAMYVGKNHQESGIKFFATDINYSIRLSNKKNEEAYAKQEKELPYTHMVGAVVDKGEVAFGLEDDIGVHNDSGHTEDVLKHREEVMEGDLAAHSEEGFKQVAHGQGHAVDTSDRGYVLKHEKGGLNFGVKAKTEENTKPHWRSPIDYFNSLVKWARFIGRFVMRAAE